MLGAITAGLQGPPLKQSKGIGFVDCGVSGGIWGLTEGYALMVGGSPETQAELLETMLRLESELDRMGRNLADLEPAELADVAWRIVMACDGIARWSAMRTSASTTGC